jgi:hypothetical protein
MLKIEHFLKKQNLITIFFERKLYNLFIKNMRIKIIFIQKLIKMITDYRIYEYAEKKHALNLCN